MTNDEIKELKDLSGMLLTNLTQGGEPILEGTIERQLCTQVILLCELILLGRK